MRHHTLVQSAAPWRRLAFAAIALAMLALPLVTANSGVAHAAPAGGALFTPRLLSPAPAGWTVQSTGESTPLLLIAPDQSASIVLGGEIVGKRASAEEFADGAFEGLCTTWTGCEEAAMAATPVLGGQPGHLRQLSGTTANGVALTALLATYVADGKGYLAIAMAPTSAFAAREPELRAALATLKLGSD